MPALNFQAQFAPAVDSGAKCQTIRAPRVDHKAHATPGARLVLYTGMRSKSCRKLRETTCLSREQIYIADDWSIYIDGSRVVDDEAFARADGFESIAAMMDFFELPFEGSLIKWPGLEVER